MIQREHLDNLVVQFAHILPNMTDSKMRKCSATLDYVSRHATNNIPHVDLLKLNARVHQHSCTDLLVNEYPYLSQGGGITIYFVSKFHGSSHPDIQLKINKMNLATDVDIVGKSQFSVFPVDIGDASAAVYSVLADHTASLKNKLVINTIYEASQTQLKTHFGAEYGSLDDLYDCVTHMNSDMFETLHRGELNMCIASPEFTSYLKKSQYFQNDNSSERLGVIYKAGTWHNIEIFNVGQSTDLKAHEAVFFYKNPIEEADPGIIFSWGGVLEKNDNIEIHYTLKIKEPGFYRGIKLVRD